MAIAATEVKGLRDKTGAGMMDCKAALTETDGDMEAAIDWLRAKGLSRGRQEGGPCRGGRADRGRHRGHPRGHGRGQLRDRLRRPQSRNSRRLPRASREAALGTDASLPAILAAKTSSGATVDDAIKAAVATIGENLTLRRAASLSVDKGAVATYVHSAVAPGLGKIGVIVGLELAGDAEKLAQLGRQIAMHVAAASPLSIRTEDLDSAVVDRERAIFAEQARESGKPEAIIEKMVEGRVRKFYEEVVLLSQAFVVDTEKTVENALKAAEADVGGPIAVTEFVCFRLGEGVEKKESDFAAEVAAAAGTAGS